VRLTSRDHFKGVPNVCEVLVQLSSPSMDRFLNELTVSAVDADCLAGEHPSPTHPVKLLM
jgi:hypothetical protein